MWVEWAKSKAWANWWHEECLLVVEGMHQVIWYFNWKHLWWLEQCDHHTEVSPGSHQGLVSYTNKQVAIYFSLAHNFATYWYLYLQSKTHGTNWPLSYLPTPHTSHHYQTCFKGWWWSQQWPWYGMDVSCNWYICGNIMSCINQTIPCMFFQCDCWKPAAYCFHQER